VYYTLYFIIGEFPVVDFFIFFKAIPYKESSQIGKRHFVAELLCVWCGSVSCSRAAVFLLCLTKTTKRRLLIWEDSLYGIALKKTDNGELPNDKIQTAIHLFDILIMHYTLIL
jgi:hypothetical protein